MRLQVCLWSLFILAKETSATTEWYGDERAEQTDSNLHPFYDVIYDESSKQLFHYLYQIAKQCILLSVCPETELKGQAIPNYVLFGTMVAAFRVHNHPECLQHCLKNDKCRAINFFRPFTYQDTGFCEILSVTQLDDPKAMRPYPNAVYYENIYCNSQQSAEKTGTVKHQKEKTESSLIMWPLALCMTKSTTANSKF